MANYYPWTTERLRKRWYRRIVPNPSRDVSILEKDNTQKKKKEKGVPDVPLEVLFRACYSVVPRLNCFPSFLYSLRVSSAPFISLGQQSPLGNFVFFFLRGLFHLLGRRPRFFVFVFFCFTFRAFKIEPTNQKALSEALWTLVLLFSRVIPDTFSCVF